MVDCLACCHPTLHDSSLATWCRAGSPDTTRIPAFGARFHNIMVSRMLSSDSPCFRVLSCDSA